MTLLIDFTVIVILIVGIWQFREPLRAKNGNLTAALALFLAFMSGSLSAWHRRYHHRSYIASGGRSWPAWPWPGWSA